MYQFTEKEFELSPIGLAFSDKMNNFIKVNKSFCDLLGYTEEEILNKRIEDVVHPDDLLKDKDLMNECLKNIIQNYIMEKRYITKNGKIVWTNVTRTVVKDECNNFLSFLTQVQDITKNKMLNEYVSVALKNGQIGIWTWFAKNNVLVWDDNMFKLYDVEKSDFNGIYNDFINCLHKDDQERVNKEIEKAVSEDEEYRSKFRIIMKNGSIKWISAKGKVVKDSLGNLDALSGINYDITDQVILEDKLNQKNKDLEHFAYLVSHDLREPLRTINGFSQLLLSKYENILDEKGKSYLSFISEGTKKLGSIIKNILDQCRCEKGDFEKKYISVENVLEKVLKSLSFSLIHTKVYKENLSYIYMNEIHLHQILQNFVTNAIKYSKSGETIINIYMQDNEQDYTICVQDNGIGIDEKNKEKLFEMFKRISIEKEGTGIGLALCKKIVDLYNGKIWVESKIGEGSTFCFSIPKKEKI